MKRHGKDLIKQLTALGFDHIWTNTSGGHCYAHPDDPDQTEIVIQQCIDERAARAVLHRARRITGTPTPTTSKRNAARARQQAAEDRERDRTRAQARLGYVRAHHDRLLNTPTADPVAVAAAQRLLQQRQAELDTLERLMREPPTGGHTHRGTGQARHYSGTP